MPLDIIIICCFIEKLNWLALWRAINEPINPMQHKSNNTKRNNNRTVGCNAVENFLMNMH